MRYSYSNLIITSNIEGGNLIFVNWSWFKIVWKKLKYQACSCSFKSSNLHFIVWNAAAFGFVKLCPIFNSLTSFPKFIPILSAILNFIFLFRLSGICEIIPLERILTLHIARDLDLESVEINNHMDLIKWIRNIWKLENTYWTLVMYWPTSHQIWHFAEFRGVKGSGSTFELIVKLYKNSWLTLLCQTVGMFCDVFEYSTYTKWISIQSSESLNLDQLG